MSVITVVPLNQELELFNNQIKKKTKKTENKKIYANTLRTIPKSNRQNRRYRW